MKPCPLCGNEGLTEDPADCLYCGSHPPFGVVGCARCGLQVEVRRSSKMKESIQPAIDEATRRWNLLPRLLTHPLNFEDTNDANQTHTS